jgi:hypothetical protein
MISRKVIHGERKNGEWGVGSGEWGVGNGVKAPLNAFKQQP